MANNFKFGVSREQQEKEQAEKQRQLEEEIQERTMEKTRKLRQLHNKQRINKIIVVTFFILFFIMMAVFGTYNTFFKQPLSTDEVREIAIDSTPVQYNSNGIHGYIYNNLDLILERYFSTEGIEQRIETLEIQKDTLRITEVKPQSNIDAQVNFEVDVYLKYEDTKTRDNEGKEIIIEGESSINTYYFSCIIGYDDDYLYDDNKNPIKNLGKRYYFASEVRYITNKNVNRNSTLLPSNLLSFTKEGEEIAKVNDEKTALIKTSVENIFINLYEGRDVSTQFTPTRDFSESADKFMGFTSFIAYTEPNDAGFNCVGTYLVKTEQGITYKNQCYLRVEQEGSTYKITQMF